MGVTAAKPRELVTFRQAARRRIARLPIQVGATWAAGAQFVATLPATGYLEAIDVFVQGTMTLVGGGLGLQFGGPWNIVNRLQVRANLGSALLYDTNGWNNFLVNATRRRSSREDTALVAAGLYSAPVAAAANVWNLHYHIPIAANWHRQFGVGLINLQAPEIQVTLEGVWGANLDAVLGLGGGAGFAGSIIGASFSYYDVPDPRAVQQPPAVVHRILQSDQVIAAAGQQIYRVPREGMLYKLIHTTILNDARLDTSAPLTLVANGTDEIYRFQLRQDQLAQDIKLFGLSLPTGVYGHYLWSAEGEPSEGDSRDMINAEKLSTLESILTTVGAPAGTVNRMETVREFAQVLR